jgi:hypothetical protein
MQKKHELETIASQERAHMSEQNRDHFDIELGDHIEQYQLHPGDYEQIKRSLLHRAYLHKTSNMYLVPPMLFPRDGETSSDHMRREREKWGIFEILGLGDELPKKTPKDEKTPIKTLQAANIGDNAQQELL